MNKNWWLLILFVAGLVAGYLLATQSCNKIVTQPPIVRTEKQIHDTLKILVDSSKGVREVINKKLAVIETDLVKAKEALKQSRTNEEILASHLNDAPAPQQIKNLIAAGKLNNSNCDTVQRVLQSKIELLKTTIKEDSALQVKTVILLNSVTSDLTKASKHDNQTSGDLSKQKNRTKFFEYTTAIGIVVAYVIGNLVK